MNNLTFDDVLIAPKFSNIKSRKDVDLRVYINFNYTDSIRGLTLPVMSSNMDTITGVDMALAMAKAGGLGVLHRFWSIEENCKAFDKVWEDSDCAVSVGVGEQELERAKALYKCGARIFVLDVAHGAQVQVVDQYITLKETLPDIFLIVGNFATGESCREFWSVLNSGAVKYYRNKKGELVTYGVDAFKIGIGPGSACTTRIKTGVGVPQLSAIQDVAEAFKDHLHRPLIIADGGMKTPGDIAKAIAAGADCVMLGGMLAGTDETPGEVVTKDKDWMMTYDQTTPGLTFDYRYKKYRGSASKEAYTDQGKDDSWRTAEGESFVVPCKGPVARVLQDIEGGLRSAFTYVGAKDVRSFQEKAEFIQITTAGTRESAAHGKTV